MYFPRTRTSWDKYMLNRIVFFQIQDRSELVQLCGKIYFTNCTLCSGKQFELNQAGSVVAWRRNFLFRCSKSFHPHHLRRGAVPSWMGSLSDVWNINLEVLWLVIKGQELHLGPKLYGSEQTDGQYNQHVLFPLPQSLSTTYRKNLDRGRFLSHHTFGRLKYLL